MYRDVEITVNCHHQEMSLYHCRMHGLVRGGYWLLDITTQMRNVLA